LANVDGLMQKGLLLIVMSYTIGYKVYDDYSIRHTSWMEKALCCHVVHLTLH